MRNTGTILAVCLAVLLFISPVALANEDAGWTTLAAVDEEAGASGADASEEPKTLEPVIVTATSIETPISRVGSSVTVITREQLEQLGSNSVIEALRQVPGLNIVQTGSRGSTTSVFTRGGQSDFTLVMIDGVKLTDQAGATNLAHITIDNVERIEVVRGPQSALYGADALSGVINIITRKGDGEPTVAVSLQGGNLDNNLETISVSGSSEAFNYSISASHFGTANIDGITNDRYNNYVLSSRTGFTIEDTVDLSFIFRYQSSETGNPGPTQFLPEDPDDENENHEWTFTIIYDQQLTEWWDHSFQASYFDENFVNTDPASQDPTFFNDFITDYDSQFNRINVKYQHNFRIFEDHIITVGTDWEQEEANIISSSDFGFGPMTDVIDEQRRNLGFYAQAMLTFYDRFDVVLGVRHDDNSEYGSETSPRVSANYLLESTGTRIKGSYGEGIKNPSFLDLFFPGFGNPDLKPEKNEAWDVGVEQYLLDGDVVVGVTYFRSDFEELIGGFPITNFATAKSEGFEVELTAQLPYNLALRGAYTFTETEDDAGSDLIRIPKHLVSLNLNYVRDKWMVNLDATYASERSDRTFAFIDADGDWVNDITDDDADSYVKLDLAAEYRLNDNISIIGSIENLLDDELEEVLGFENPGINFLAGVRGVF